MQPPRPLPHERDAYAAEASLSCSQRAFLADQIDADELEVRVEAALAGLADILVPLPSSSPFRPPGDALERVYV